MRYNYKIREDVLETEEGERCTVYGIDVMHDSSLVKSVGDLFCNKNNAKNFAELCSSKNIPPDKIENAASEILDSREKVFCNSSRYNGKK